MFTLAAPMFFGGSTAAEARCRNHNVSIDQLYIFGDSLSDVGNVYISDGGTSPGAPYVNGQFTNGNVWAQDLAGLLNVMPLTPSLVGGTDYAFGGALSGRANSGDLLDQVKSFQRSTRRVNPNGLYVIWIGSNDLDAILTSNPANPTAAALDVVSNVDVAITQLAMSGARHFLVLTVPDMGKSPLAASNGPVAQAAATALGAFYNQSLVNGEGCIPSLNMLANFLRVDIDLLDISALVDGAVANAAAYGFTNVTQPCLVGEVNYAGGTPCSNPNSYLFWDQLHPTAAAHAIVAQAAFALLQEQPTSGGN